MLKAYIYQMKTVFFLITIIAFTTINAQDIEGNWKGSIHPNGQSLTIVFHFVKQANGTYKSTFDSPDQKVFDLQGGTAIVTADSLINNIALIKGGYYGKIEKDSINGVWRQGGGALPLVLYPTTEVLPTPVKKPQTPVAPFPYQSQNVTYTNVAKTITYGATFTYPNNTRNVPVVILISGSGQQDRDCSLMGHKWFLVLADYLTKNGIAVLRVDDRGVGETTGDVMNATSADFATDVEQGIAYIKTRKEIDIKKIGLIGHSEGGIIAPMVAARNKNVAYIVMLAGPGIGGAKINEEQNVASIKKAGLSDSAIQAFRLLHRDLQQAVIKAQTDSAFEKMVTIALKKSINKQAGHASKEPEAVAINSTVKQYNALRNPWFKFFMRYKPAANIASLKIPVLALNGSKDTQVDASMNMPVIKNALLQNKSPFTKTAVLPGLNHLFQQCKTGEAYEYEQIDETINPAALQTIGDWLKQVNK